MNKLESWKSLERNGEKPSEIAAFGNAVSARRKKCRKYRTNPIRQTGRRLKIQLNYFWKIITINPHQHFQTTYHPTKGQEVPIIPTPPNFIHNPPEILSTKRRVNPQTEPPCAPYPFTQPRLTKDEN
ncbi:hypothetical protein [Neisseria sp. HMSC70E02]|jgi:hypothetical protein|uniref:hypothetical protein n=1 Tax=Neisseria sp. HMSC70E02 TaxID=1608896 RepID=UPI00143BB45B|nr:hypothetical protein [Neisseria sp. HMSC70E02]